jgi:O-antigen/teichoic acid export membrane protein
MAEASSLRREIVSAYLASGAKIGSWVVISAAVFRVGGAAEFGILALIRGTVGVINYLSLGLTPAMVRLLVQAGRAARAKVEERAASPVLSYAGPLTGGPQAVFATGMKVAMIAAAAGMGLLIGYSIWFGRLHNLAFPLSQEAGFATLMVGLGLLARLISEAPSAVLQTYGKLAKDNYLLVEAEICWVVLSLVLMKLGAGTSMTCAAMGFMFASLFLMVRRFWRAANILGRPYRGLDQWAVRQIVHWGGMVTLAHLADFLYAPTDYVLINWFLGAGEVAAYAPAVQIDAALLVLVMAISMVLFPRSAVAHAAGDVGAVRKYYVRGTLASAGILAAAAVVVWLVSPWIFRLWLGNPMPETRGILPLVLVHTVIGGSAMVGRSVLLASGKFAPFAISVLIAGVTNVALSFVFVKYLGWGLKGIVMGTIIAVVLRCLIWMPWYVMRALREVKELPPAGMEAPIV